MSDASSDHDADRDALTRPAAIMTPEHGSAAIPMPFLEARKGVLAQAHDTQMARDLSQALLYQQLETHPANALRLSIDTTQPDTIRAGIRGMVDGLYRDQPAERILERVRLDGDDARSAFSAWRVSCGADAASTVTSSEVADFLADTLARGQRFTLKSMPASGAMAASHYLERAGALSERRVEDAQGSVLQATSTSDAQGLLANATASLLDSLDRSAGREEQANWRLSQCLLDGPSPETASMQPLRALRAYYHTFPPDLPLPAADNAIGLRALLRDDRNDAMCDTAMREIMGAPRLRRLEPTPVAHPIIFAHDVVFEPAAPVAMAPAVTEALSVTPMPPPIIPTGPRVSEPLTPDDAAGVDQLRGQIAALQSDFTAAGMSSGAFEKLATLQSLTTSDKLDRGHLKALQASLELIRLQFNERRTTTLKIEGDIFETGHAIETAAKSLDKRTDVLVRMEGVNGDPCTLRLARSESQAGLPQTVVTSCTINGLETDSEELAHHLVGMINKPRTVVIDLVPAQRDLVKPDSLLLANWQMDLMYIQDTQQRHSGPNNLVPTPSEAAAAVPTESAPGSMDIRPDAISDPSIRVLVPVTTPSGRHLTQDEVAIRRMAADIVERNRYHSE